jgi:hypothetical protein
MYRRAWGYVMLSVSTNATVCTWGEQTSSVRNQDHPRAWRTWRPDDWLCTRDCANRQGCIAVQTHGVFLAANLPITGIVRCHHDANTRPCKKERNENKQLGSLVTTGPREPQGPDREGGGTRRTAVERIGSVPCDETDERSIAQCDPSRAAPWSSRHGRELLPRSFAGGPATDPSTDVHVAGSA